MSFSSLCPPLSVLLLFSLLPTLPHPSSSVISGWIQGLFLTSLLLQTLSSCVPWQSTVFSYMSLLPRPPLLTSLFPSSIKNGLHSGFFAFLQPTKMLSCLLSSVTTYVWEKPKEWVSSPGSPRLQSHMPVFPLGISISVFWLPLTQRCKTRLSPQTVCSCYWHYCSPRHKPLRPSITFIPTLFSPFLPVSCKPCGFFLEISFRLLCLHLYPGPHLALALLHWYLPSLFVFFKSLHYLVIPLPSTINGSPLPTGWSLNSSVWQSRLSTVSFHLTYLTLVPTTPQLRLQARSVSPLALNFC